jgi:DegV family protein with EDD domain
MEKIAIVTDSTSDLTREYLEENHIYMIPLKVVFKEREYLDRLEITPEEVYARLPEEIPTTSTPSIGEVMKMFQTLVKEGYKKIISIHISSGLSATQSTVLLVAREIEEENPDVKITVIDGLSISYGTGMLVRVAAKYIKDGMSFDEVCMRVEAVKKDQKVIFILDTLHYLHKGGRIGHVTHMLGSVLNLKPVIAVNKEGVYYTIAKVRGRKDSISRLIEIAKEEASRGPSKIAVLHGDALKDAEYVYNELRKQFNNVVIYLGTVGPVIGVHTGPGTLGVVVTPSTEIL